MALRSKKCNWKETTFNTRAIYSTKRRNNKSGKRFDSLLESKNLEIKQLKEIINESNKSEENPRIEPVVTINDDSNELAVKISKNAELKAAFNLLIRYIQAGWAVSEDEISSTKFLYCKWHNRK